MGANLQHRDFLKELDFTRTELQFLLDLSRDLKRAKYAGTEEPRMRGKNIALIFEKTSTRTRCAFEVAAHDQGAHVTFLDPGSSLLVAGAMMGMDVRMVAPTARWNHDDVIKEARRIAELTGARITHTEDV